MDFILKYTAIISKLSLLFRYQFIPGSPGNKTFVGRLLFQILSYNNEGDYRSRDFELNRLAFLVQQLENIKANNNRLFYYYINLLKNQDGNDSYWGQRFEVSIASSLLNKKVDFIKHESPDFLINKSIGIECSSIRIRKSSDKTNFDYKISSLLNRKNQKFYSSSSTALFVDFTNMLYNLMLKKAKIETEEIKKFTHSSLMNSKFGSVLLFALVHTKESLEQNYLRVDNQGIDKCLESFLNQHYPLGYHYIKEYGTSVES